MGELDAYHGLGVLHLRQRRRFINLALLQSCDTTRSCNSWSLPPALINTPQRDQLYLCNQDSRDIILVGECLYQGNAAGAKQGLVTMMTVTPSGHCFRREYRCDHPDSQGRGVEGNHDHHSSHVLRISWVVLGRFACRMQKVR